MKTAFPVKALAMGGVLLFAALGSAGTTLGRAQGAVFVGKPLDLLVQLQVDGDAEAQSVCLDADVFYGEAQVDPARVSVKLEPATGGATQAQAVRVLSSVLINEPLVTVNLRAGCQHKSSRRYVLFPDVSSNVVEPLERVPTVAAEWIQARRTLPDKTASAGTGARPATPIPAVQSTDKPKRPRQAPVAAAPTPSAAAAAMPAQPPAPLPRQPRAVKSASKSRLKLDSLDLLIERDPVLRASSELVAAPQGDPLRRAEAAALWRALNASPEDLMRDEAQAQRIEKDLQALYAVTAENQKGLVDLVAKVQNAQSERYANGLVYSLAALCLVSVLALVWVGRRLRAARAPSWMHGLEAGDSLLVELAQAPPVVRSGPEPVTEAVSTPASTSATVRADEPTVERISAADPEPLAELDFDLDLMALSSHGAVQSRPSTVHAPAAAHTLARDFAVSVSGGLRAIDSEELVDVRQQADFFVSVGQHQKAIDVLTTRIAQVGESSPLVCLDLLKIYHALGRQSEFEFMRTEFNNWFTGRVPAFHAFSNEGRALDHYPQVMNRIVAMWPDPVVLEYIENCLYHHSTEIEDPHFDLEAYRELLLLHGVAKRIVRLTNDESDSHLSELMRIPPRAQAGAGVDASRVPGSADPGHRAGAHHRNGWKRGPLEMPDRLADVETRPAPLGVIKLPPGSQAADLADSKSPRSKPDNLTDFNFLSLH